MCGFFAVIGPRGSLPDEAACRRALATLADRGPDGEGLLRLPIGGNEMVMGHRRLALVGLQSGDQPILSERSATVVNGEFYHYQAIRARLQAAGARFATASDSEILPHLYEAASPRQTAEGGPGTWIRELIGEWAFALLDRGNDTLWAACDPWGTKPLRWCRSADGRTVMLATTAKALFALGVPRRLDEAALRFALGFQYLPWGRTLFAGIHMLPPGGWLHVSPNATTTGQYWNHTTQTFAGLDSPDPGAQRCDAAALRDVIEAAVARRIPAERDFCTHLSGGVDSAIVTALAGRQTGRRVSGYCASFPWAAAGDETAAAARSAVAIGAELRPVRMSEADLLAAMDQAPCHAEGLANNLHAGAKLLVSQAIRQDGYRIAFTGEGADEAFLGYEHFRWDIPAPQRPPMADPHAASAGILRPADNTLPEGFAEVAASLGQVPSWIAIKGAAGGIVLPTFGARLQAHAFDPAAIVETLPAPVLAGLRTADPIARARALWMIYGLSGYILRGLDDALGMANAVESRLAFLDPAVQAFGARIPATAHYDANGLEKALLREAMADLLPADILARPKRAFMVPSLLGLAIGQAWARERLLDGRLVSSHLFTAPGLEDLLAAQANPVRDAAIYTLASLACLMEAFALG